jgi:hypothetical protein
MKEYNKNFEFILKNDLKLKEKLKKYFFKYNYKQIKGLENQFSFVKKWSLLDGFTLNILNWETKINIEVIENKKVLMKHTVITNGFGCISPIAFRSLFEKFLCNLEKHINQNEKYEKKNNLIIKSGKIKLLKYISVLIIGATIGIYFGVILRNLTEIKLFGYLGIIIGTIATEKILNRYLIKKNSSQQHL